MQFRERCDGDGRGKPDQRHAGGAHWFKMEHDCVFSRFSGGTWNADLCRNPV